MYGASLTKSAFSDLVLQLVDEGRLTLDTPLSDLLPQPLPAYEEFTDLASDDRWRALTMRVLLTHTTGFHNFRWLEDDNVARFHHDPGTRYGYSGEGFYIAQLVLKEAIAPDVGAEMQQRLFDRFDMPHTSMPWRWEYSRMLYLQQRPVAQCTMNHPPALLPFTAPLYISRAEAGGLTNRPAVVARAR